MIICWERHYVGCGKRFGSKRSRLICRKNTWRQYNSECDMAELTRNELERQDFVDNRIFELLRSVNPSMRSLRWNIEMIGDVRDVIETWLVHRHQCCSSQAFYPYLK